MKKKIMTIGHVNHGRTYLQSAIDNVLEKERGITIVTINHENKDVMRSSFSSFEDRIDIVNQIIKKIASLDRKFFEYKGKVAYIFNVNKNIFMRSEYNGFDIDITKSESIPYEFTHGGTIWGLTKDFKEFIITGKKSNGENGYGGLYSPHWGYSSESMEDIRQTAIGLGYL